MRDGAGPVDVLDGSGALRAEGRVADAIDLLTEANRADRPGPTSSSSSSGPATTPSPAPDRRRRRRGPPPPRSSPAGLHRRAPRVDPADLDLQALRDGLATGGCLLVPGLDPTGAGRVPRRRHRPVARRLRRHRREAGRARRPHLVPAPSVRPRASAPTAWAAGASGCGPPAACGRPTRPACCSS